VPARPPRTVSLVDLASPAARSLLLHYRSPIALLVARCQRRVRDFLCNRPLRSKNEVAPYMRP
jgi:hypothetical protein